MAPAEEIIVPLTPRELARSLDRLSPNDPQWQTLLEKGWFGILRNADFPVVQKWLPRLLESVSRKRGIQAAYNLLLKSEAAFHMRAKPSVGFYDHNLHLIGGGQKYGCTMARALQDDFDVTLIAHREVTHRQLLEWYGIDLSACRIRIIPLPFFDENGLREIDPGRISVRTGNPFAAVSRESGNHDIFINNSMVEKVLPLANESVLVCHFPERRPADFFYCGRYRHIVYNSLYTAEWIRKKWKIAPTRHIFPPVDMASPGDPTKKEKTILSVARFESGGSKQQDRMIGAFAELRESFPRETARWKLVLAGGSVAGNPFLSRIRNLIAARPDLPVDLKVNIPVSELLELYRKAGIFWHFCGLHQTEPALVEHFGMTTVEAMQNGCVPVVFDGGGQREIVEEGRSGFRFAGIGELIEKTVRVITDLKLRTELARAARERGLSFTREAFESQVKSFFREIADRYASAG